MYDGDNVRYYVRDKNILDFIEDIKSYELIVTYNGKQFDVPFIEKEFGIKLQQAHIDLRFLLRELGYSGGLKACEKILGLERNDLDGVDGMFAVHLWHEYIINDNKKALESLLAYNIMDAINLEKLMVLAFNLKLQQTPFYEDYRISIPSMPILPVSPDVKTIEMIRQRIARESWM